MNFDFSDILIEVVKQKASDLHLTAGTPPMIRQKGALVPLEGMPKLTPTDTREIIYAILNSSQRQVRLLESRCYGCHGPETQKAGVALHHYHTAHQPTDHGRPLWISGKPDQSLLLEKVTATDHGEAHAERQAAAHRRADRHAAHVDQGRRRMAG